MKKPASVTTGIRLFILSAIFVTVYSCSKTDPPPVIPPNSSLTYMLALGTGTTIFNSAVIKAGLDSVFSGPAIFTLLVPTDQACTNSGYTQTVIDGYSRDQARAWVLYQTYAGSALTFESFIGAKDRKLITADGDSVFVSGDSNRTYVNGYQFLNSEVVASNGIMLAMQNVLVPPSQNLYQMMSTDTSLSFFTEAIQLSSAVPDSLSSLLSNGGPFSVLAPYNNAFRNKGYTSPSDLTTVNADSLRTLVLLSLIPQRLFSYDVGDSTMLTTYGDSTLIFYLQGLLTTVRVLGSDTSSNIISANQMATNGVLFKIDALLEP